MGSTKGFTVGRPIGVGKPSAGRICWRLYYADGGYVDEAVGSTSIRLAPSDPLVLALCEAAIIDGVEARKPLVKINLVEGDLLEDVSAPGGVQEIFREPGKGPWRPIVYRKRGINMRIVRVEDGGFVHEVGKAAVDGIVFGRARDAGNTIDVNLYAWVRGELCNCPAPWVDYKVIEDLVVNHGRW